MALNLSHGIVKVSLRGNFMADIGGRLILIMGLACWKLRKAYYS